MKYETLNKEQGRHARYGTGIVGTLDTEYLKLTATFGSPTLTDREGDFRDLKTRREWVIRFEDGLVATIYDYRESAKVMDVTEWHVGGTDKKVVRRLEAALKARK